MNNTKVYLKQGGDELVVAAGGKIVVEQGGDVEGLGDITAIAWSNLPGRPPVVAGGADKADARDAIDAADVDHDHAVAAHAESGLESAASLQELAEALSARIKALEDAASQEAG